jgi:hypothetical protein
MRNITSVMYCKKNFMRFWFQCILHCFNAVTRFWSNMKLLVYKSNFLFVNFQIKKHFFEKMRLARNINIEVIKSRTEWHSETCGKRLANLRISAIWRFLCQILHSSLCTVSGPGTSEAPCSPAVLASSTNLLYSGQRKQSHRWWGWKQLWLPLPVYSFTPAPASSTTTEGNHMVIITKERKVKTSRGDFGITLQGQD